MYDFKLATELHYGTFQEFVQNFGLGKDDLIVTNAPILEKRLQELKLGCQVVYQEKYGMGEPNDKMINNIVADLKGVDYNRVVAVGGGTVIDVSKVLTLQNVENVLDILYGRVPVKRIKKLVVVPTTCGTGSEVTNLSILEDTTAKIKKGIASAEIISDHAVLIPELLMSAPYKVLAFSSIDALIHAVESYLAPKSNPMTELFGVKAIELILPAYRAIASQGQKALYENVGDLLLASTYAGIAFGSTGVGAVHALSYGLGGAYHVAHGESNYCFFDAVLRVYEAKNPNGKIAELRKMINSAMGLAEGSDSLEALNELLQAVAPLKSMKEHGAKPEDIEPFTDGAMGQERLMKNNYVPLTRDDVQQIFESTY